MRVAAVAWAATVVLSAARPASAPTILVPAHGEPAYRIAGEAFGDLWERCAGVRPALATAADPDDGALPAGDVVLVGSDAVNPVVQRLLLHGPVTNLGIRYGTDDYRVLSLPHGDRTLLLVAGASGRSTIYAAYDFFRRQAGAEYFWDGDTVPRRPDLGLAGSDIAERPHFGHRGLRYFAHRGPHRFHAEMWDLEDWKREIDWILKKRMNLFMLRTGIDDLFQRAFDLPYPPEDGVDPDAEPRSYNDRTSLWSLKYRGELRKQVLAYARERGLLHPEDTGTITHWYSHTPSTFHAKFPDFPVTRDQKTGYSLASAAIWDVNNERAWDAYWKLTATHIREFGEPRMFHTIGLAERRFGTNEVENLNRKMQAYRRIQEVLRRSHPDAPLLIASWDLMGWWRNDDVKRLLGEFDPARTILLDYTADVYGRKTYRDWDASGRFPWIFGVFHAFAADSDIREDYAILRERIGEAAADPQCRGLVLWPEISHSNTLLLEYLAANGWRPDRLDAEAFAAEFCDRRYPSALSAGMKTIWRRFLPIAATHHWTHGGPEQKPGPPGVQFDPHFRLLTGSDYTNLDEERVRRYVAELARLDSPLDAGSGILSDLAGAAEEGFVDERWRRDAIDIARTIASRALKAAMLQSCVAMEAWRTGRGDAASVRKMEGTSKALLRGLGDLLALSDDFSLHASLRRLERAGPLGGVEARVNPHAEQTLKGNSENNYCRAHQYELVRHVYGPEMDAYWEWVNLRLKSPGKDPWKRPASFTEARRAIQDRFYATPLADMAPPQERSVEALRRALAAMRETIATLGME
jgi:hypothetical protein